MSDLGGTMNENLRDKIQEVARAFIVREVGEDAGPMMTERARDFTGFVWEVVGPELDRLRAEVGQRDRARMESADRHQMQMDEVLCRAEAAEAEVIRLRAEVERWRVAFLKANEGCTVREIALATSEAERDDLRARLAKVEALLPVFEADYGIQSSPVSRLRAALAFVPEPSDSEPADPLADWEAAAIDAGWITEPSRCPHVAEPGSRHEDEDCGCIEDRAAADREAGGE